MQSVRDKDNGDALFRHGADGSQQRFRLLLGEHRGRLVQDQDLELILAELTRDLRELLVSDGHFADDHVLVDVKAHLVDGGLRTAGHFIIIKSIEPVSENLGDDVFLFRFAVQENILRGGKARDQGELLMHHADAGSQRVKGRAELYLLAVNEDIPLIAAGFPNHVHTEEDFHESALACAVFAAEP